MDEYKLILAFECKRTVLKYGHVYYSSKHQTIVDGEHTDSCDSIAHNDHKVTEIIAPLKNLKSIWDMKSEELDVIEQRLVKLQYWIGQLVNDKVYTAIAAKLPKTNTAVWKHWPLISWTNT